MTDAAAQPNRASHHFSVGLTGGIGSGKSIVARLFAACGADVIDTDQIARELTAGGGTAIPAIRQNFGNHFIDQSGAMNRIKMRQHVFSHPSARELLESILHPLIQDEVELAARRSAGAYLLVDIPLLIESKIWPQRVSRILVVDCPEQLQIKRVMQRNHLSELEVRAILAAQATRIERRAAADDIIVNDRDIASLQPEVDRLHALYCDLAAQHQI